MNRNVTLYNHLVRKYYQYKRRLANLQQANRNHRRQGILAKHIERIYQKLVGLKVTLRFATAASAFALTAMAVAPQTADAQTFGPVQTNPFGLVDNGDNFNSPVFIDLDNDGDYDIMSGPRSAYYGSAFKYYENTGTNINPQFSAPQSNPFGITFSNTVPGGMHSPTFVDLDGDGDYDMLDGVNSSARIYYYENTGDAFNPSFANPVDAPFGMSSGSYDVPSFVDLDDDGDFDLMLGRGGGADAGKFFYFQNTGTNLSPSFNAEIENPFGLTGIGSSASPSFIDLDNDGDFDLFSGDGGGNFRFLQNVGNASNPSFDAPQTNIFGLTGIGQSRSRLAFADLDGDGDFDLIAGKYASGDFYYFENTTPPSPDLVITEIMYNPPESFTDSLEFIEIYNNGSDLELENFTCTGGDYVFPDVTLAAGEFYVLAGDSGSFNAAYGFYPNGLFTNALSNSGEDIVIKTPDGAVVDSVDFSDGGIWPSGSSAGNPDGGGASIVLCNVNADNNDGNNWSAASADVGVTVNGLPLLASPGELNPCSHLCGVLTGTNNTTICFEESIVINGTTYDANNPTGTEVFTGIGEYNCDSTVTVSLNVLPQLTATNNTTICYDGYVEVNGTTYNAANPTGTEVFSNISPDGCDLTVTVNLNVLPELTGTNNTTICHDGSVDINGTIYDANNPTGTEVFANIGPNGCDSTVTVSLNVLPALSGTDNTTICNDESVVINGTTYDAGNPTGTEVFTNIGPNGCDSTVTVNLNVLPDIDETIDNTLEPTLSANQTGATYQWIDCDNGNAPISGATDQTYTVTSNGNYAVEVTVNGCTETSPCINVIAIGVSESSELAAGIYPNPSSGLVNISLRESAIGASYKILSAEGKLIRSGMVQSTELRIDLSTEAKGVYTIELSTNAARSVHMLILE